MSQSIDRSVGQLASLVTAAAVDLLSLVTAAAAAAAALCGKAGVRHLVVDGLVAHLLPVGDSETFCDDHKFSCDDHIFFCDDHKIIL